MFFVCFLESIYVFCVICPWGNICVSLVFFWRGYVLFSGINSYALYGSFLENITFLTAGFWNIFLCFVCISQYIYGLCNVFWDCSPKNGNLGCAVQNTELRERETE